MVNRTQPEVVFEIFEGGLDFDQLKRDVKVSI